LNWQGIAAATPSSAAAMPYQIKTAREITRGFLQSGSTQCWFCIIPAGRPDSQPLGAFHGRSERFSGSTLRQPLTANVSARRKILRKIFTE
jgi:hypothetical protein